MKYAQRFPRGAALCRGAAFTEADVSRMVCSLLATSFPKAHLSSEPSRDLRVFVGLRPQVIPTIQVPGAWRGCLHGKMPACSHSRCFLGAGPWFHQGWTPFGSELFKGGFYIRVSFSQFSSSSPVSPSFSSMVLKMWSLDRHLRLADS